MTSCYVRSTVCERILSFYWHVVIACILASLIGWECPGIGVWKLWDRHTPAVLDCRIRDLRFSVRSKLSSWSWRAVHLNVLMLVGRLSNAIKFCVSQQTVVMALLLDVCSLSRMWACLRDVVSLLGIGRWLERVLWLHGTRRVTGSYTWSQECTHPRTVRHMIVWVCSMEAF